MGYLGEIKMPKVMIIDDDTCLLQLLATMLRNMNFTPLIASCVQEAFAYIDAGDVPDLVLLDIKMPDICGFDAFDQLRTIPCLKAVKIIAFTAYAFELEQEKMRTHGFDNYISKPFKKSELINIIAQSLGSNFVINTQSARSYQ